MASIEVREVTSYILELDSDEAEYLKCLLQNPSIENEPEDQEEIRESLFNVLKCVTSHAWERE